MMQSLVFKRSEYFICMAMINSISTYNRNCAEPGGGGGGGERGKVSPRKSVVQSVCQYDVTSRVSNFHNGEQRDG